MFEKVILGLIGGSNYIWSYTDLNTIKVCVFPLVSVSICELDEDYVPVSHAIGSNSAVISIFEAGQIVTELCTSNT